jgi:hypothetical protein
MSPASRWRIYLSDATSRCLTKGEKSFVIISEKAPFPNTFVVVLKGSTSMYNDIMSADISGVKPK